MILWDLQFGVIAKGIVETICGQQNWNNQERDGTMGMNQARTLTSLVCLLTPGHNKYYFSITTGRTPLPPQTSSCMLYSLFFSICRWIQKPREHLIQQKGLYSWFEGEAPCWTTHHTVSVGLGCFKCGALKAEWTWAGFVSAGRIRIDVRVWKSFWLHLGENSSYKWLKTEHYFMVTNDAFSLLCPNSLKCKVSFFLIHSK